MAAETLAVTLLMKANQYKREARQAATATGQISSSAGRAQTATGKLDTQMSGLATTAKFAVAGAATTAVVGFAKQSVDAFLGFDDAMNQSLAIMGDVSGTMREDMADAAREIGRTTRIGAEEAAEAYFFLASAGLDAEQSVAALPQVAAFAQAGMFDMATATDLATDAQAALGLSSDDASANLVNLTRVTDVFVKANTLANTSVQQISEAMTNKAGAAMRAVGIDIEEGAAVLAAFADQGTKGAEAGTQFSIVLRDLQTKALNNKEAFEEAGIAVFDSRGEFRNFADIISDLETRLDGMSDAQKKAELATLGFSDKSIGALTTLLGTSEAIREYETELRKAAGTTEEIAENQLESFQGQMDLLRGRTEDVMITLGEGLVPLLLDMAETVMPLVDLLGVVSGAFVDLKENMGNFGDVILGSPLGFLLRQFTSLGEETKDLADEVSVAADRVLLSKFRPALEDAGDAAEDAGEQTAGYTKEVRFLRLEQLALANPALAAVNALNRYKAALNANSEAISEYGENSQEANAAGLDLLESYSNLIAEAQSYADVAGVRLTNAIDQLGREAGLSESQISDLKSALGELDDLVVEPTVTVKVKTQTINVGSVTIDPGEIINVSTDGIAVRRHTGGHLGEGQMGWVGESGPEWFQPDSAGRVIPTRELLGGTSGPKTVVHVGTVYGWDDFVRKVRDAGVEIQRT